MSRFFKFLIIIAAVINLVFVFVFEGRIPSDLPIPFVNNAAETAEEVSGETEPIQTETEEVEETAVLPEETEEAEPEEEELEEEEPAEEEPVPQCRVISIGGSNIRSGPGTGFEIVTSYPYDTVLVLTGEPEIGWYPILAEDGTEGYIFENQIEILNDNAAEEDVPLTEELNQQ